MIATTSNRLQIIRSEFSRSWQAGENLFKNKSKMQNFFAITSLIAACLLVYWPVFTHQFQMKWDDQWVVINQYTNDGFTKENLHKILTEFFHGQYAPVNELFYLVIHKFFGFDPFWFHSASLAVHICNVLLVFFLFRKLLKSSSQFDGASIFRIAFITSLFMSIHPFLVEAVSWMAASKCILFALFYILALHTYVNYLITQKLWQYGLTIILFILSFGAKEQAVTMPVCLLLFDFVLKRDLKSNRVWSEKLPFFCLSICFAIITFYSQAYNGEGILSSQTHYPFYQNLVFACYTITEYVIKCILPIRLSYLYPFPNLPGEQMPLYLWLYPFILIFVILAFWKFWTKTWVLFGVAFFLIQISIATNIIPTSRFAIVADRYVYLPSIGIFFLIAYLLDLALQTKSKINYLLLGCTLVYFTSLSIYARQRCNIWHNSYTLKKELNQELKSRNDYNEWIKKKGISN